MNDVDMNKVHLDWCIDMLKRIMEVLNDKNMTIVDDKLDAIRWYTKQGLKVEREE